jgi:hypothetical protein
MMKVPGALLLTEDWQIVEINLPGNEHQLAVMYAVLRCRAVDVVALTSQLDMWIDDEGLYNHGVNEAATLMARRYGFTWQAYHGPVLLTGGADENGDTVPLTRDKLRALLAALGDVAS